MEKDHTMIFGKGNFDGHRFHIRQEKKGGTIVIDASGLLFLYATGFDHVILAIEGTPMEEAVETIIKKYRVDPETAKLDYNKLQDQIKSFLEQPDVSGSTRYFLTMVSTASSIGVPSIARIT